MYLKSKKFAAMFLACLMLLSTATACGKKKEEEKKPSEKTETPKNPETPEKKDEKIVFKDMIGREITLAKVAKRVMPNSPETIRLYCYIDGSQGLLGIPEIEKKIGPAGRPYAFANPDLLNLPVLGGYYHLENYEKILMEKPDVFITTATKDSAKCEKIQGQINAPVIVLDYGDKVIFEPKMYQSLEIIGKFTGKEDKAKKLIDYMESIKKDLQDRTKDIPESKKKTAYVGGLIWNGPHGIEGTRANYPLFDVVNVKNVVTETKEGHIDIDKEQLLKWNPDYIFLDLGSMHLIQEDYNKNKEYYRSLKAFKNGNVHAQIPFVACHVNVETALANAYYIGKVVYPENFQDVDIVKKSNEIFTNIVGKPVYEQLTNNNVSGYQKITLQDLDANKFYKPIIKKKN